MKKYWTVAALGWQDSLVYRFNALIWILYSVLPSITLMLVWIAAYRGSTQASIGGFDLGQMMTYYLFVTALAIAITPNPEWDMAQAIRDGKITSFLVRPMGYFGYRVAWETSYQIIKSAMFAPAFAILLFAFRQYLRLPPFDLGRAALFFVSAFLAYVLLTQFKFLLGVSAFWLAEVGGLLEIGNILNGVLGGRMLPLEVLPTPLRALNDLLPFASFYSFPMQIFMARISPHEMLLGFARQTIWIGIFTVIVKLAWRRGLLAYEAYGG